MPPAHGVRLILAQADGAKDIISTTDYKVAYLQSPNKDEIHWVWIKYRHPVSGNWVYTRIMGDIYGGQTAGVSWKNHRTHVLVVKGGFMECKNMESIYYHPERGIIC